MFLLFAFRNTKFIMDFMKISSRCPLPTMIIVLVISVIHSVSSLDCSPPFGEITCDCTDKSIECSGTQKNISEVQDILLNANYSLLETVILKLVDLRFDPKFTFENTSIQNLTLGYNLQIPSSNFFSGSSSLISLNLQNNSIQNIDGELFSSLSALKELVLDFNDLQDLNSSTFASLTNLNYLSIKRNNFHEINSDVFQNASALETLILSHNNISSLGNLRIKSLSLIVLEAADCSIEGSLRNDTFLDIPNLQHLDLSYNKLSEVMPRALSTMKNLKFLNLSFNSIIRLDENAFSEMNNLTSLDLRGNEISVVKLTSFANLRNVKYLDLSENNLTGVLCEYTTDFDSLERIYLKNNKIKIFTPGAFFYSPQLTVLDIAGNYLECSCPLTDTALYLIENSTMKKEDLESISCFISSTRSSVFITNYKTSKCAPQDPCKKLDHANTESPEDYDYDYEDEATSTIFTDDTTDNINASTLPATTVSIINTTKSTDIDPTTVITSTIDATSIANESTTPSTMDVATASVTPTAPMTAVLDVNTTISTDNNTTIIASTVPVKIVPNTEDTTQTTANATAKATTSPAVVTNESTESTTLSTVSSTTTAFTPAIHTTNIPSTESTTLSTKNSTSITASSTAAVSSCSSLDLSVDTLTSGSDFTVVSNFSYDGNTFCLKWTIIGNIEKVKRCLLKFTAEEGTKSKYVKCPSVPKKIEVWSVNKKVFKVCFDIFAPKKVNFCNDTLFRTTTTSNTGLIPPAVTLNQKSPETVSLIETTTYLLTIPVSHVSKSDSTVLTTVNATASNITPSSSGRVGLTETTTYSTIESSESYIPTTMTDKVTTPNLTTSESSSTFDPTVVVSLSTTSKSTTLTERTSSKTKVLETDSVATTMTPVNRSSSFFISALNVYFNNSNLAFATWTVSREAPTNACNLTLLATTQYFDYEEGTFPCKNNSHRLRNVKETDIFKICIVSHHETSGKLIECTLSVSPALESKSTKDDDDSFNNSMIPLICLLILVAIIILFIIFKNVFKKTNESNKYDVRAEEVKYEQRVKIRPQSSNDQSLRFSYIARENFDNV